MPITTAQIRGARGLLNWSQQDLAERTNISATSIGNIENGQTLPRESTLIAIEKAFTDSGIEFLPNDGMRRRAGEVQIFQGRTGFLKFFETVYNTIAETGIKEVLVCNVDERKFAKWHGASGDEHIDRMNTTKDISYKVLSQEGDDYFPAAGYAEYRWLPKALFSSVPFYVFGKKLGIIIFDNEPTIIVLDYPAVTEAYKLQFKAMWDNAIKPVIQTENNQDKK